MNPTSDNPLVLVVDDYEDARELYAEFLEYAGFRVIQASNGQDALDQAFATPPDCILMDLSLPVMDGWEATARLKADPRTRHVPVVALSGHTEANRTAGRADVKCDAFMTKPCLPDDVVAQIRRVLASASPREPLRG